LFKIDSSNGDSFSSSHSSLESCKSNSEHSGNSEKKKKKKGDKEKKKKKLSKNKEVALGIGKKVKGAVVDKVEDMVKGQIISSFTSFVTSLL
jgi:hypothetical protein